MGDYKYTETIIDGKTYGSMSDIVPREIPDYSVESVTLNTFIRYLEQSRESKTRMFAGIAKKIRAHHAANGDDVKGTPLYLIARECEEKSFRTTPNSVEREFLLITATSRIKKEYNIDVI